MNEGVKIRNVRRQNKIDWNQQYNNYESIKIQITKQLRYLVLFIKNS